MEKKGTPFGSPRACRETVNRLASAIRPAAIAPNKAIKIMTCVQTYLSKKEINHAPRNKNLSLNITRYTHQNS
jgi:hypothetical protein